MSKSDHSRSDTKSLSARFGSNTFNATVMREKLPKDVFFSLQRTIDRGEKLQPEYANTVAHAMKEWALERGASHYCHWFQPMTGSTAEKHDAFLSFDKDGTVVERFSGSQLIQSEPDASSFPSGGMRSTFEARGYTAWDPTSPAFLLEGTRGNLTLCIPSVFLSYHGQALDEKTPLLRSMDALNRSALAMLRVLGNTSAQKVTTWLGPEQEYFLVDHKLWEKRPDLVLAGRTLLGRLPPKGQQLEDHYFGVIHDRVMEFMSEVEEELYKLGVPAKTRHNEVAPHQYEIAPIHEETNVAGDHNLLVMETMRKVANRKGLSLLLHEKPFAGINGSGKHNNWSMGTDDGVNLLDPGQTPRSNLQFLVFLVATIRAVHRRAGMLRASIASAGNDHRLGANEAPPAIMSVFLGQQLDRILNQIESGEVTDFDEPQFLHLGLSRLPAVNRDYTDRNRTSPFAFTGNKFEFRAVPSSMPVAMPNTVLNAAVSEALDDMAAEIQKRLQGGAELNHVVLEVIREEIRATKPIRFEGDNYSNDWQNEAARRGLPNARNTPEALRAWLDKGNRQMFIRSGVLSDDEISARYAVRIEQYVKQIDIEAKTLLGMLKTQVLPACMRYQGEMARAFVEVRQALNPQGLVSRVQDALKGDENDSALDAQLRQLNELADNVSLLVNRTHELEDRIAGLHHEEGVEAHARYCVDQILPAMNAARDVADQLEGMVDARHWPFPTYLDLLFHL